MIKSTPIMYIFSLLIACGIFFGFSYSVHAQTSADSIFTDIIPETPGAFQDVTIKLKSYSYNLLGSKITWTVDGKVVLSDTGAISYSFKTKDVGKATNIVITVLTGGETIQKGISIQPQNVDMLWEAPDSYVPPFYKGKALPATEGQIRVVAFPIVKSSNGTPVKTNDFIYKWSKNFGYIQSASGYNKQAFSLYSDYFNDQETVSVEIIGISQQYKAQKTIKIKPSAPKLVFYKEDPDWGVYYNKALGRNTSITTGTTIIAAPYNFSPKNPASPFIRYTWLINDKTVQKTGPSNKLSLTVGSTTDSNLAKIDLSLENTSKLFQKASHYLVVNLVQ